MQLIAIVSGIKWEIMPILIWKKRVFPQLLFNDDRMFHF